MKLLQFVFISLLVISCSMKKDDTNLKEGKVIITGKLVNPDPENNLVTLNINRLGFSPEIINLVPDSSGNFRTSFKSYIPSDASVDYLKNHPFITHPGDIINIEIDGSKNPDSADAIRFTGNSSETNNEITALNNFYFKNATIEYDVFEKAFKEIKPSEFILLADSIYSGLRLKLDKFVSENVKTTEAKIWGDLLFKMDKNNSLSVCLAMNKLLKNPGKIPEKFFDQFKDISMINKSSLFCTSDINLIVMHYSFFATSKYRLELQRQNKDTLVTNDKTGAWMIKGIKKYAPNSLIEQLWLTKYFSQYLEMANLNLTKNNMDVINQYIKAPYLKKPLLQLYEKVKYQQENPKFASDSILKELGNSTAAEIIDSVRANNKGKVVYVDCWATWCGPCRAEMPETDKLIKEYKNKQVVFVFLNIDSERNVWKTSLSQLQIGKQHYWLNKKQSTELRSTFQINGIPYHFFIDKNGTIIKKNLVASEAKSTIDELLKEQ